MEIHDTTVRTVSLTVTEQERDFLEKIIDFAFTERLSNGTIMGILSEVVAYNCSEWNTGDTVYKVSVSSDSP